MEREAAIQAAEDYCKIMNGRIICKDVTGNLRSSYSYAIKSDTLIVFCRLRPIHSVDLPHVDDEDENK